MEEFNMEDINLLDKLGNTPLDLLMSHGFCEVSNTKKMS